jgi:hypothetical protein
VAETESGGGELVEDAGVAGGVVVGRVSLRLAFKKPYELTLSSNNSIYVIKLYENFTFLVGNN